ncbi:hypothetical protein FPOA_11290 [Fusarium poae]|uniref:Uncharacterized protein n=1 Tax=Fusarium poae TaxID=36050 RepID=A0A1B8AGV1_FUSPO|nr:hypothetical protein FPOA_11290 [Fusarium poae]
MSGPPTPVLDCPLVYLEIRDDISARAYNSQSHGIFTLTIEGQRPVDAETGALIVLIRKETQQVVSFRLTETAEVSRSPGDMVSVNKQANRLCICVPGRSQAILVQFEKTRDFSVTVCLLQKAGFHVSDALPTSLMNQPTYGTTPDYGPLLSPITPPSLLPLNTSRGPETQHDIPFATMLAAPFQPSQPSTISNPWASYMQRYVSVPIQPYPATNQLVNTPPVAAQLNPYNMFLDGGNTYSYVARTFSPVGHSFVPNPPLTHWHGNDIGTIPDLNTPDLGFSLHEPVVHPNLGPNNLVSSQNNHVGSYVANGMIHNKTTDEPVHLESPQNDPQEYRNLMPQPRTLPFESSKGNRAADGGSKPQETKQLGAAKARKPRKTGTVTQSITDTTAKGSKKVQATKIARKKANVKQRQSSERDVSPGKTTVKSVSNHKRANNASAPASELTIPFKKSSKNTYEDAECQTDMQPEPNSAGNPLGTETLVKQSSTPDSSPLVIVTDPDTLKDLHEATTTLFGEYEKGIEHCGNQARHAELYLHRIWEKRRDFWLRRLRDNTDVQWHGPTDELIPSLDGAA